MSDSPYKTLGDISNAIIADCKENSSNTALLTQIARWVNEGHELVTLRKKRDWLDEQRVYQLSAKVQDTCTVTNGSTTVTFESTSTAFVSGIELQFYAQGFEEIYNVASATDNVITLAEPYLGETSTSATGVVYQSSIILDSDIRFVYQGYHQHSNKPLTDIGPQQMRLLQEQQGSQEDYASYMSIFGQDSTGSRRLLLYPTPNEAYTLYLDVNTFVPMLEDDDDEPVIPMQYRQILYWYAMYKYYMFARQIDNAASPLTNFNGMLARIDGEMRAELDFPQIQVMYPRRSSRRFMRNTFDPRYRE